MDNEKIENLLNLSIDTPENERLRSPALAIGFDASDNTWEVVIKYFGETDALIDAYPNWQVTSLLGGYAIVRLPEEELQILAELTQVEYIEKPKEIYFEVAQGREASCLLPVQSGRGAVGEKTNLTGAGVLVAVIDSGIDYRHPDFCNEDGSSRIVELWDMTAYGENATPPEGYPVGAVYTNEQINEALRASSYADGLSVVPQTDSSGHGTHVAGIAAGNGRASGGRYRGVAFESDLLIVKLGTPGASVLARTTQLMMAVDYCVKKARALEKPIALNLSYGNNYGSHSGNSLLETYLTNAAGYWKTSIVVGSGNEAARRVHTSGVLEREAQTVTLAVASFETSLNLQIWKSYADTFRIVITNPAGTVTQTIAPVPGSSRVSMGDTTLLIYYGEPSPYSPFQEIFLDFLPQNSYISPGEWTITLVPERIVEGNYDMWLPAGAVNSPATGFLFSTPDTTLTIPSTAAGVITVGAYDSKTDAPAAFSGRGYTRALRQVKPQLVAPGVDIISCSPGGGYTMRTGTSMATPFVTGSAALLMQWGIVEKNDAFLYGQKLLAYLIKGARALPVSNEYPNPQLGWGALCVADSLPS